jgi:hypothetical protein
VSESEERVPIGYPLVGNELAVVDDDGALTPDGKAGELLVRSPYVALGTICRKMSWPGPVIGIQARGLDGYGLPHTSVEEMADEWLSTIRGPTKAN